MKPQEDDCFAEKVLYNLIIIVIIMIHQYVHSHILFLSSGLRFVWRAVHYNGWAGWTFTFGQDFWKLTM